MTLSDGTEIYTTLKILGPIRAITDKAHAVIGAYFLFNTHKLYFNSEEDAETIRNEIREKIPHDQSLDQSEKAGQWSDPPTAELKKEIEPGTDEPESALEA